MKTLAAVLEKINAPLKLLSLDIPPLKEGQVLVKIAYTGLCHTQLNEIYGKKGEDKYLPHTLGHEGSGIVAEIGPGVTKVKKDDHVVLSWISGNGLNAASTSYLFEDQIINSGAISTFMSHAIVSENRIIPIRRTIPLKEAALLGCALPTGMGIILNNIKIRPGNTIAIFGVGGIGMSALIASKLMHASQIIAIDICPNKLELASQIGATHTVNALKKCPVDAILDLTNHQGVDFAVEAAGKKQTMESAFNSVKKNGGLCVITGNLPQGEKIEINPFDLICGKRIEGTWGGESDIEKDIKIYCDLLEKSAIDLSPLISHTFTLSEINTAIKQLTESKNTVRCLIQIN
ncbi:MAG: S-(hydroxymethyl)glutathione dehydrogenase [Chlamydiae bacterium]|nr:S-(hydroxymethyl)glutathione dehydrogenase [Chlamydiota bacterium]